jgi:hypothetical protein
MIVEEEKMNLSKWKLSLGITKCKVNAESVQITYSEQT